MRDGIKLRHSEPAGTTPGAVIHAHVFCPNGALILELRFVKSMEMVDGFMVFKPIDGGTILVPAHWCVIHVSPKVAM